LPLLWQNKPLIGFNWQRYRFCSNFRIIDTRESNMKLQQGFTLIELMVVVFIIGILAAIALPNYTDYVIRGKITDATSALSAKRVQMEQYYQDRRTYVTSVAAPAPSCVVDDTTTSRYFDFTCKAPDGAPATDISYTIAATGKGSMAGFTYTINQSNVKTSTITAPAPEGWKGSSQPACWITKVMGKC
jgi:type IV pilus assembly protein PilE